MMKLDELHQHKAKHADDPGLPVLEYSDDDFARHVRELYQEIKPRPDQEAAAQQWDREVAALINIGQCTFAGVHIRRV